jgi:hypothetical protein
MPTMSSHVQRVMTMPAVDVAVTATAQMFGLPRETVAKILEFSLQMTAERAGRNPELLRRLYAMSCPALPAPPQEFYALMAANTAVRQAIMDDFKAAFGATLDGVNREAARRAGTTDGQAREAFAATLPAVNLVLGQANVEGTERGFAERLRDMLPRVQE